MFKYKVNSYTFIEQDPADKLFYIYLLDSREQLMYESSPYGSFKEALKDCDGNKWKGYCK